MDSREPCKLWLPHLPPVPSLLSWAAACYNNGRGRDCRISVTCMFVTCVTANSLLPLAKQSP